MDKRFEQMHAFSWLITNEKYKLNKKPTQPRMAQPEPGTEQLGYSSSNSKVIAGSFGTNRQPV